MEELINQQNDFRQYLRGNDYTFIGPVNQNLFEPFMRNVNILAPVVAFSRSIHHALSHEDSILKSIATLPAGTPLRLYVIINESDDILIHSTIEEYCDRFGINYRK